MILYVIFDEYSGTLRRVMSRKVPAYNTYVREWDMNTNSDISSLIKRSDELGMALSQRSLTSEEVRWGAGIALAGMSENDLFPLRRRRLRAWLRLFSGPN